MESSDKTSSTGVGNGKPLQYSCPKKPMISMRKQKDSRVLHKGADLLGLRFVPVPGPSSSADQVLGKCSHPQWKAATYCLPYSVFWRKGNPLTLLVGMQTSTAAMENSVEIP